MMEISITCMKGSFENFPARQPWFLMEQVRFLYFFEELEDIK